MIGAIHGESESHNSLRNQTEQEGSNANRPTLLSLNEERPRKNLHVSRENNI